MPTEMGWFKRQLYKVYGFIWDYRVMRDKYLHYRSLGYSEQEAMEKAELYVR